jgi:glutamyl-tRNA reductase
VFRHALHAGRKVRAQTAIGESPASVSAAAAALAEQVFGDLAGCSVLLIGAGDVSGQAARNLRTRGARIAFVADSKTDRAQIEDELARADVVVSSTSAPGVVLDAATVERARRGRQLLFIDLAVPRDLDPAIHALDGCYLYDIDDLEAIVAETLAGRRSEAERAEAIVSGEADKFHEWQASLEIVPAIASLRAHAEEIREQELAKGGRVDHRADREQAPAPADRAPEAGGRGSRWGRLC